MKKMKPFKEKPGLKRFEIDIYWGKKTAVRLMVAPSHEMASENLLRSLGLQIKRDKVIVIGTHMLGPAY